MAEEENVVLFAWIGVQVVNSGRVPLAHGVKNCVQFFEMKISTAPSGLKDRPNSAIGYQLPYETPQLDDCFAIR